MIFPVIDMVATGRNIERLRIARGLSVADIQQYFGFEKPQAIYKWQQGVTLPSVDNLYALSYLLGVPIKDILVPTSYTVYSQFGGRNQNRKERVKLARERTKHNRETDEKLNRETDEKHNCETDEKLNQEKDG